MKELRGMPVAKAILADLQERVDKLIEKGVTPKLTVVRVGAREDDLSYERGIYKRFEGVGAKVETMELPLAVTQEEITWYEEKLEYTKTQYEEAVLYCTDITETVDKLERTKDPAWYATLEATRIEAQETVYSLEDDIESIENSLKKSQEQLENTSSQLEQAKRNLEQTKLTAKSL